MIATSSTRLAVESIGAEWDALYGTLFDFSNGCAELLGHLNEEAVRFTLGDLRRDDCLEEASSSYLRDCRFPIGAGIALSPTVLSGTRNALEWWVRDEDRSIHSVHRLRLDLSPDSDRFYNYQSLLWFERPMNTGKATVGGPYVDYLGQEEYILTCTVPLWVRGVSAGIAGCDVRTRDLEECLIPSLRLVEGDAVVADAQGRVIATNSGWYLVGERVRKLPEGAGRIPVADHQLGLYLVWRSLG